jgi:hypothetical protein
MALWAHLCCSLTVAEGLQGLVLHGPRALHAYVGRHYLCELGACALTCSNSIVSVSAVLASEAGGDTLALAPSCTEINPKEHRLVGFETGLLARGDETNMRIDAFGDLMLKHVSCLSSQSPRMGANGVPHQLSPVLLCRVWWAGHGGGHHGGACVCAEAVCTAGSGGRGGGNRAPVRWEGGRADGACGAPTWPVQDRALRCVPCLMHSIYYLGIRRGWCEINVCHGKAFGYFYSSTFR